LPQKIPISEVEIQCPLIAVQKATYRQMGVQPPLVKNTSEKYGEVFQSYFKYNLKEKSPVKSLKTEKKGELIYI